MTSTPQSDDPRPPARFARPRAVLLALRDFGSLLVERFFATRCAHVAGSLTYTTLLALVPLITLSLVLFSNFPAFSELGVALSTFLQNNVLPEAASQIGEYAVQFSERATNLTLIGTIMLIVTVLLLLGTIDEAFNEIWGVRHPRPIVTRIAVYWVALTLGPIALAGSIFATGQIVATSIALIGEDTHTRTLATNLVPLGLLGTLLTFLYFAVPNHPVRLLHAMAGGFSAAFAFLMMQRLFGLFITLSPTYTLVYGAFAAVPIFLIWLYASWVLVLLGAIFAATFPEFFERKTVVKPFPGDQAWAATNMLTLLARGLNQGHSVSFDALHEAAGLSSDQVEALLGQMQDESWIVHCEDETWALCRHPDSIRLSRIVERFALAPERWASLSPVQSTTTLAARRIKTALDDADLSMSELASQVVSDKESG
jgi:membrane protein